jgi:formylglycine-generating enzyme required for sulfatase activity
MAAATLLVAVACGGGGGGSSTPAGTAPKITTQPANQTVNANNAASFTVVATGTPTPTYTWERSDDSGTTWAAVSGATSATYSFTAVKTDDAAQFRAKATNTVSTATSDPATLTMNWLLITTQPAGQNVTAGDTAHFSIVADSKPSPTYQWQSSADGTTWIDISGATAASYDKTGTVVGDNGTQFRCALTNTSGTLTLNSDPATLNVNAAPAAPVFSTQPATQTVAAGSTASFTVAASGVPSPTFTWERSNNNGTTWVAISGATGLTYSFTATITDTAAQFRAKATNTVTTTISDVATLTVTAGELTIAIPDSGSGSANLVLEPIASGSFEMGDPGNAYARGTSHHTVTIGHPFYMAKYECTQGQWKAVTGTTDPSVFTNANYPGLLPNDVTSPVDSVTYDDVTSFLAALNTATASTRPAGLVFRLPTEAEWEYACRANTTDNYYFGPYDPAMDLTTIDTFMWSIDNSPTSDFPGPVSVTHPVGQLLPNAWGLYDMAGNVWEFCQDDWHESYDITDPTTQTDPVDATVRTIPTRPNDGNAWIDSTRSIYRVARGGSFQLGAHYGQSYERGYRAHDGVDVSDGFRVVLALPLPLQ